MALKQNVHDLAVDQLAGQDLLADPGQVGLKVRAGLEDEIEVQHIKPPRGKFRGEQPPRLARRGRAARVTGDGDDQEPAAGPLGPDVPIGQDIGPWGASG
jgi:hypothetical protein